MARAHIHVNQGRKGTRTTETIKYWTRQSWRAVYLIIGLIILFALVMAAIKVIPIIWTWGIGK